MVETMASEEGQARLIHALELQALHEFRLWVRSSHVSLHECMRTYTSIGEKVCMCVSTYLSMYLSIHTYIHTYNMHE